VASEAEGRSRKYVRLLQKRLSRFYIHSLRHALGENTKRGKKKAVNETVGGKQH